MATYNGHNMTLYVDGAKVCGFGVWLNLSSHFGWVWLFTSALLLAS